VPSPTSDEATPPASTKEAGSLREDLGAELRGHVALGATGKPNEFSAGGLADTFVAPFAWAHRFHPSSA
jgi:hypothetical protein